MKLLQTVASVFRIITSPRFLYLFVAPHVFYIFIAWITADPMLIVIFNLTKVALAVMVCIAFGPAIIKMLSGVEPIDRETWLIFGIFLSWYGNVYQAGLALVWRYLGEPTWIVNSDLISYPLFVVCIAAVIHVAVPKVIKGSVPPSKWIGIGAVVGAAVFVGLLTIYWQDVLRTIDRTGPMHDRAALPALFHEL